MCNRDGDYEFFMTVEGYRRCRAPGAQGAGKAAHITGRYGLPFFIYRHRKRWYYGAGIMAFFHGALCHVPVYLGYPV
ncbi:MAG: sporulation protein YqfD [Enterocloster clostridioformis]